MHPSFKNYLHEVIFIAYADARKLAIKESKNANLGIRKPEEIEYPLDFPFTIEQLLDEDFYGELGGDMKLLSKSSTQAPAYM
ncbi:MAG: DUF29 family protein [Cuspidothrix sp.]